MNQGKPMISDLDKMKILVIEDEPMVLDMIVRVLKRLDFDLLTANHGDDAMALFEKEVPPIVLTDINLPGPSGIEILKRIKKLSPVTQVIIFSGVGTTNDVIEALRMGASDYLIKPVNIGLLTHTINRCIERYELIKERRERKAILEYEVRKRTAWFRRTFYETVKVLGRLTEKRDPYTAGHQHRVALLAMSIGKKLGLSAHTIEIINVAGLLHDIGKIAVPVELLVKPAKLTTLEMSLMKMHPQASYDIIKDIPFVESLGKDVSELVLTHHERLDGSGYPDGLSGDQLEIESKILCVSDVIEAMLSHRPYRPALDMATAKHELISKKGQAYCPKCVEACLELIDESSNDTNKLFVNLTEESREVAIQNNST
jgi:putative two-component system response regulator